MASDMRRLGRSDLVVAPLALGTMTWGQQNTEAEAHAQIDFALERGINLIDTAEMYPVPPMPETQGRTEAYIGNWFARSGKRDRWILATKVAGPSRDPGRPSHIRTDNKLDRRNIEAAVHSSLRRLRTDCIDLYQLHWPDRTTNMFGALGFTPAPEEETVPLRATLEALASFVRAGKIRHVGVSNETPWGLNQFLALAEEHGLPRVATIQNPCSLVNRTFEIGLAEIAWREQVSLLAYSPLAFGTLTGKYMDGIRPEGARLTLFERFRRYDHPLVEEAVRRYVALAREHGLDPAQMAIAHLMDKPWTGSVVVGATSLAQLETDLGARDLVLPEAVREGIESIHRALPNPVQ